MRGTLSREPETKGYYRSDPGSFQNLPLVGRPAKKPPADGFMDPFVGRLIRWDGSP